MKLVISRKNLPTKLPITSTIVMAIALDYYSAPEWLCGVLITFYTIVWIAAIVSIFKEKDILIFDEKGKVSDYFDKSKFQ